MCNLDAHQLSRCNINQCVDPCAVAIAFKNLVENHPEAELEIVAMEKHGNDKFLLRAKTTVGSDKS
jgi:hypothetical protein